MGATVASDINVNDRGTLIFILALAFIGSFLGNALGLGGGFIYNPVSGSLDINIKQCRDLAAVDIKRNRSDP